jgi:hypothetical protein
MMKTGMDNNKPYADLSFFSASKPALYLRAAGSSAGGS